MLRTVLEWMQYNNIASSTTLSDSLSCSEKNDHRCLFDLDDYLLITREHFKRFNVFKVLEEHKYDRVYICDEDIIDNISSCSGCCKVIEQFWDSVKLFNDFMQENNDKFNPNNHVLIVPKYYYE